MGIDIHNLGLLAHAQDLGVSFERTVGIGRQAIFIEPADLQRHRLLRGLPPLAEPTAAPGEPRYFELLMRQWLGARVVDSVDASAYEQARLIHDMNLPWPAEPPLAAERGSFDAVLDFGCLEHVFDFPVAWRNCVDLCRIGGHVLHALPANNLVGHGFYQFSPELFFNLYRPERGFALKALFFAVKADSRHWWRVANPMDVKRRVTLRNGHEVYMLVLAQKLREAGALAAPQQSDYAERAWLQDTAESASGEARPRARPAALGVLERLGLIDAARRTRDRFQAVVSSGLALPSPDFQRVVLDALLRGP